MGRGQQRTAESKRRILEATLQLASENGYDAATVAKVTEATGSPASSIYWHFGNKEKLVAAAVEHSYHLLVSATSWPEPAGSELLTDEVYRLLHSALFPPREDRYLRLGLMLVLEQRETVPLARQQYLGYRAATVELVRSWWHDTLTPRGLREVESADRVVGCMVRLTFAALDACYVGGDVFPEDVDVFRVIAPMLAAQAEFLLEHPASAVTLRSQEPERRPRRIPDEFEGRERLLAAAEQVVSESGLEGGTVARICERAELPVSSLYWFFDNKEHLIAEVMSAGHARWSSAIPWETAEEIGALLSAVSLASADEQDYFRIGHMLLLRRTADRGQRTFVETRYWFVEKLAEWVFGAYPVSLHAAREVAWGVLAIGDGVLIGAAVDPRAVAGDIAPLMDVGITGFMAT